MKTHPHPRSFRRTAILILAGFIAALFASHAVQAATQNWNGTSPLDANWSTGINWSFGAAPGSTSLTTSTDIAIFNRAIANTWGDTALNPIVIDSTTQNIRGISFIGAAGNYFIGSTGGNALKLSSGGSTQIWDTLTATDAIETINAPLVLQGINYTFANDSANGSGTGAGTLNFGGGITGVTGNTILTLNGSNTNANTITGVIGNGTATAVGFVKSGTGTWVLTGANTFTGAPQILQGTLSIDSIADTGVAQPLGQGTGAINLGSSIPGKLQFTGASGGSSNRRINLIPNGSAGGGMIENTVAGQTLSLGGNVSTTGTFPGLVSPTFTLELTGAGDGVLSGTISNPFHRVSTTKSGDGTWTFSGANTYGGDTTVSGGTLKVGNTRALGFGGVQTTSTGVTTVNSGFTLDLNGTTGINEPIILNGTGIGGNGALVNNSGNPAGIGNGIAGLAVPATGVGSGLNAAPSVVISGSGTGATATASLGLTTASITSVSGGTGWVTGDIVQIGSLGALGTVTASGGAITAITVINAGRGYTSAPTSITRSTGAGSAVGVTLTGNANNFTVGGLTVTNAGSDYTGTPTVTVGGLGGATPTLSSVNLATDSSIGGSGDISISSVISGAGLTKVGAGTLTLSGANTYTGNTTVHGGILKLDTTASIASSASIIVGDAGSSGAHLDATTATGGFTVGLAQTLKGIGTIDGNTTILGTHAPGNSPGLQTFNGNLAYSTGSMVNLELRSNISTDTSGIRGVHFDAVDVIGTGVLSIGTGVTSNLIFNGAGSAVDFASSFWTSDHTWLAYNDVSAPVLDSSWIFDAITASTDSLGASIAASAFSWEQTGNDVFLKFTAVPEPAGVAIGLLCLGVAAFRRRRA